MSARRSTGLPFACSGDMYAAVPRITPACVAMRLIVGELAMSTRRAIACQRLRQTEIENLHRAVAGQFDVRGLQIAMDDAALVRVFERLGDLLGDRQRFVKGNRAAS